MITYTGTRIEPENRFDGKYSDAPPNILDIGVALGRMPRWAGATRVWWSVLHHSLLVSEIIARRKGSERLQLLGLLHDAHEAITGDVPAFWKPIALKTNQMRLDRLIRDGFDIDDPTEAEDELVKEADEIALRLEAEALGPVGILAHLEPYQGDDFIDLRYGLEDLRTYAPAPNDSADGPQSPLVLLFLKRFAAIIRAGNRSPIDQPTSSQE